MLTLARRLFWLAVLGGVGYAVYTSWQRRNEPVPNGPAEWPPFDDVPATPSSATSAAGFAGTASSAAPLPDLGDGAPTTAPLPDLGEQSGAAGPSDAPADKAPSEPHECSSCDAR